MAHDVTTASGQSRQRGLRRGCRLCFFRAAGIGAVVVPVFLLLHAVPLRVTEADRAAVERLLDGGVGAVAQDDFAAQIAFIRTLQEALAEKVPGMTPIPRGASREPADLLNAQSGLCHDRSRMIEKALRLHGFKVRHVALYQIDPDLPLVGKLLALARTRELPSHSVTECRTTRGWLVVDSNHAWASLDADGNPVPLSRWLEERQDAGAAGGAPPEWGDAPPEPFYSRPFVPVYGLYSRHGRFYPPYNPIPDVNWREMIHNLRK